MKNRFITVTMLLVLLISLTGNAKARVPTAKDQPALIYVTIASPDDLTRFANTRFPLYALLEDGLLTAVDHRGQQALQSAGLTVRVIDPVLHPGMYYLVTTHSTTPALDYAFYGQVLLDISQGVLIRIDPSRVDLLAQAGAEMKAITLTPKPLPQRQVEQVFPDVVNPDPLIQSMIDQVTTNQVYTYDRQLAGELPVYVDGGWYTITSRYTNSGIPIQKTTSYVGQHMANLGMDVDYHVWSNPTAPDVIGEIPGMVNPEDIFIIGGHIDDVSGTPGADDNASGSVATLIAADILSQYQWGCTLRFAFWTGEEQGLLGSEDYAQEARQNNENIIGYLNLDMIAWNTLNSAPYINLIYSNGIPGSYQLAQLYSEVIDAYKIDLLTRFGTGISGSDHYSFWQYNFNSILAIEDDLGGDFNPYYHGPGDTPAHTDPAYFTEFVKASLATYAHMSGCLIPSGVGQLDGHVTAADGGAPINGATITAQDANGRSFTAFSDETGSYTRTLLSGTYTVTAESYGYLPYTVSGVAVTSDTTTTQDFALLSAPTHIISGTVTEVNSNVPLLAEISFDGSPTVVWTDPSTGFYQAELPENSYTMRVSADLHHPQQRNILLDQDQIQDFALEPLPCILLVDDDQDTPDVNSYYTTALNSLGADYDIWDTIVAGDPALADLSGYQKLLWYTGYPYQNTFNTGNENTVSSYLDAGGNFFLSSQDYLYEMHQTPFNQNYLHILNYQNDIYQSTVTGQQAFSGLGPYTLTYPFTNYSDAVNPDALALTAFKGDHGNAAISYAGDTFKSVFFSYPFEAISQAAGRLAVMERLLDFFGVCTTQYGQLGGRVTDAHTGDPFQGAIVIATPPSPGDDIQAITDPGGYYTMTLPTGAYTVTVNINGYVPQSHPASIFAGETTTLDFAMVPSCKAVSQLNFTWLPIDHFAGEPVAFSATAQGTTPIDFEWNFGDTYTGTGAHISHVFEHGGTYTITVTASNACSTQTVSKDLSILQKIAQVFLPVVDR